MMLFLYFCKMKKLGRPKLIQINLLYLWHIIYPGPTFKLDLKTMIKIPNLCFDFFVRQRSYLD